MPNCYHLNFEIEQFSDIESRDIELSYNLCNETF